MKKPKYLLSVSFLLCSLAANAGVFAPLAYGINAGQSEMNISGGASYFKPQGSYNGTDLDFGGSGAAFSLTALRYVNPHLAVGVDAQYADNGKGGGVNIGADRYNGQAERGSGLFYAKWQLTPQSPLRLYVPVGIGVDYLKTYLLENGKQIDQDSSAGIALMFGLGLEVETGPYSFIGIEGRYTYNNYLGGNDFDVHNTFYPSILFKAGMRFEGDIFL